MYVQFSYITTFIHLMPLNRLNLGRKVTLMKYLASVVSLIFLSKTWNKITFGLSNSLNFAVVVVNELMKIISKKLPIFIFL